MKSYLLCSLLVLTQLILLANATLPDGKLEKVTGGVIHGEGPHWSDDEQALYWVDISAGDVWRYHPESNNVTKCHLGGEIGVVVPIQERPGWFIIGHGDLVQYLVWDGRNDSTTILYPLASVGPLVPGARLNDGKVDNKGRFWVGTIGPEANATVPEGSADFYRISCDATAVCNVPNVETVVENVTISNGIAWSDNNLIMYYIDTPTRKILSYDYDEKYGNISNPKVVYNLNDYNYTGVPDGMTIDNDNNLWIALYGGSSVLVINPFISHHVHQYFIPNVTAVTSVAWGGPKREDLYITTSQRDGTPGGEVFRLSGTGARGKPANKFEAKDCLKTAQIL